MRLVVVCKVDVDVDEGIGATAIAPGLPDFGRHLVFSLKLEDPLAPANVS
jgi:hypothetical protein